MGEHRTNPLAMAKAQGQQIAQVADLGDGVGFAGFEVRPMFRPMSDAEGAPMVLVAGLFALAGRVSSVALSVDLHPVLVGEIGGIPVEMLKKAVLEHGQPKLEAVPS